MEERSVWVPSPAVLLDVGRRWPEQRVAWHPEERGAALVEAGFLPEVQLDGARFGVVVAGAWRRRRAVAKVSADPAPAAAFHLSRLLSEVGAGPAVLHSDPLEGSIVLERVDPGRSAYEARPPVPALQSLMLQLRRLPEAPGETAQLSDWLRTRLTGDSGGDVAPGTNAPAREEQEKALQLLETLPRAVQYLHGDCTPGNLLQGYYRWWLVDPRPVAGDFHYDLAVGLWKSAYSSEESSALIHSLGADPAIVEAWRRVAVAARV